MDVMHYIGASEEDKTRVLQYFTYVQQYGHPAGEGLAYLADLPAALRTDLSRNLYGDALACIPIFADLEPAFIDTLASRMRIVTFTPSEW